MNKKIGILHLEDSLKDAELIRSIIDSAKIGYSYFLADNEHDFLHTLETEKIDLIISDFSMPDYCGNEALKVVMENYPEIPFIFVSGTIGEDAAINLMVNGATDYVQKSKLERLVPSVKRALHEQALEREHRQTELAMKESEERYKAIFNDAPMGVALIDSVNGKVIAFNPMFAKIAGRTNEEMLDIDWMSLTHPDDIQPDQKNMTKMVAGEINGFRSEKRYIHPDGSFVWISMTISHIFYDDNSVPRHLSMIEDITDRKKMEEGLVIAQTELAFQNQEKAERAGELIIANKELVFQNREREKRADELFMLNKELSYQNEEKEKQAHELKIAIKELAFQNNEKEQRANELFIANKELAFQNREKEKRADEVIMANKELAFQNHEKEKRAAELIIANQELHYQNEEKEKRAAELVKAMEHAEESDNLKTAFLHNLSHEIRTPMNQILGFSSFLSNPELSERERDDYIGIINSQSHQLLRIIDDIVEISEITTGQVNLKLISFNIGAMMDKLVASCKPKAELRNLQLHLKKGIPEADAMIRGDQVKLIHVFSHLIENAIKFTDTGHIDIEYSRAGDRLIVAVKDTGIGIDEVEKKVIFDKFRQVEITTTRKYSGLGLGLSISNAYIRMMSGLISVESAPGVGSTFTVEIPYIPGIVVSDHTPGILQPAVVTRPDWKDKTLLIAEDEESNVQYLVAVLRSSGIHLLYAVNGLEAVEQCKSHPEIEVVLMDIKMPRMDGMEATKIIKSFRRDLRVIATTAFAMAEERDNILQSGCDDYLPKPIKRDDLIAIIQKHLCRSDS